MIGKKFILNKVSWHNKLDTFFFTVLIMLNTITLFRYNHFNEVVGLKTPNHLENIQILIAYLPLLYMALYISGNVLMKLRSSISSRHKKEEEDMDDLSLFDESNHRGSCDYKKMNLASEVICN